MTTFFKLVMNGSCMGQDIRNIFYYRSGVGIDMSGLPLAGAPAVAANWVQEVWPKVKAFMPNQYTLDTVDVSPINNEFELIYQMPVSEFVGEPGAQTNPTFGIASCAIFKFRLEPTSILNGIKPPSRGYVALGPLPGGWCMEDGYIDANVMSSPLISELCAAISSNVEQVLPVPQSWFPVRLKVNRILGGLVHWESYSDISGCVMSRRYSFRRSRMPES